MNLSEIQSLVFEEYKKNGYYDRWERAEIILRNHGLDGIVQLGEVGLFCTEIAEAMEDIRDADMGDQLGSELADIIIRVLNFASRMGIDIERQILAKHETNMERGQFHGRHI